MRHFDEWSQDITQNEDEVSLNLNNLKSVRQERRLQIIRTKSKVMITEIANNTRRETQNIVGYQVIDRYIYLSIYRYIGHDINNKGDFETEI